MLLHHGSNVEVRRPTLLHSRAALDFGAGFYFTSDFAQAESWAKRAARLRREGQPLVSAFTAPNEDLARLNLLVFDGAGADWLRYVAHNRTARTSIPDYDVIIGPVANDQTIRTVNDYIRGRFSKEVAIRLLLPQKLKDQYAFKTNDALRVLQFVEVIQV